MLLVLSVSGCARDASYPNRPITLLCPWGAGGGTDSVSRQIAAHLEQDLGVPVSVVNATGGKGVTGHSRGFSARPDGYTLTMATLELNMLHWNDLTDLTYHDCTPLMSVNEDYAALLVRSDADWKTVGELEAAVRAAPRTLTASGTASGGAWHLALAGWLLSADLKADDIVWVSSTGAAPSLKELLSGGVDMVCCSLPEAATQMRNGDVRPLGVMAPTRAAGFEDVPTFIEQGRDWTLGGWRGVIVPKDTPPEIVDTLSNALQRIVTGQTTITVGGAAVNGQAVRKQQTFPEFMATQGFDNTYRPAAEFQDFLAVNDEKFGELLTSDAMQSVNQDPYNAMAFPSALIVLIALLVGGLIVRRMIGGKQESGEITPITSSGLLRFAAIGLAVVVYALAAETGGFLIVAGILMPMLLLLLGNRPAVSVLLTLAVVPLTYQFFAAFLRVPLPPGWWGW